MNEAVGVGDEVDVILSEFDNVVVMVGDGVSV